MNVGVKKSRTVAGAPARSLKVTVKVDSCKTFIVTMRCLVFLHLPTYGLDIVT